MSSKKTTPPQEDGGRGNGCHCMQQAELVPAHPDSGTQQGPDSSTQQRPDSSTQQRPNTPLDKETLEVFQAYNRYVLESLQDNFDRVMAIAQQVTAAEHERDVHVRCSHVGGGRHEQKQQ